MTMMTRRQMILAAAALVTPSLQAASGWREGDAMPDLKKFGLAGSLPNLKGKVIYLDFWASWWWPVQGFLPRAETAGMSSSPPRAWSCSASTWMRMMPPCRPS